MLFFLRCDPVLCVCVFVYISIDSLFHDEKLVVRCTFCILNLNDIQISGYIPFVFHSFPSIYFLYFCLAYGFVIWRVLIKYEQI